MKWWNPDFQSYPCFWLVQEVEDIPEDAESEEGPLVISSKWSAFCECLCVSWAQHGHHRIMSFILKTTCRSKRNWRWEASSICPRRFWGSCWQAGREKPSVAFSMLVSIVCSQPAPLFLLSNEGKVARNWWRCCSSARRWRKRGWSWKRLDFAQSCQVDQGGIIQDQLSVLVAATYRISLFRFSASSSWFSLFHLSFRFEASFVCASFCISFSGFLPFPEFFLQASKKSTFTKADVKQGRSLIWVLKDVMLCVCDSRLLSEKIWDFWVFATENPPKSRSGSWGCPSPRTIRLWEAKGGWNFLCMENVEALLQFFCRGITIDGTINR